MATLLDVAALMAAYRNGDISAFKQVYDRHTASLFRFLNRLLGNSMAGHVDEVFQESWIKTIKTYSPGGGASFKTYLFTVAYNAAMDRWRSHRDISENALGERITSDGPFEPEGDPWQQWPDPEPRPDDVAFWRRAGEKLLCCLEELPFTQKSVFLLHHEDGLSLDEVARSLQLPFESAKSRLRYALKKLRACMGAYLDPLQ